MVALLPRIDTFILKCFFIYTNNNIRYVFTVFSMFNHHKVKLYPMVCVALCDGT